MARDLRKGNSDRKRSVTGRLRPGGKRRQGALNRETIVAAALSEIDRNGLESFSLRGLAKTLKVYPSAIVWHVTGRTSLLADAASLALADILPPGFPESWQGYLRDFFHRFREALRRHPNVAPLLATSAAASTPDRRAILTIRSLRFAVVHSDLGIPSHSRSDALIASVALDACRTRQGLVDRLPIFFLTAICRTSRFNY
jgi:AcrR family transcriptional regulator